MKFGRASGVLLHPTSLAGDFGIGDFGDEAFKFIDFLRDARQAYWQMLPLGPTGYGDSPYQCFSAFAGNTLLISPEKLGKDGLLTNSKLKPPATECGSDRIDYGSVYNSKGEILRDAFRGFQRTTSVALNDGFKKFTRENGWWLDDYALYRAIKTEQKQKPWYEWMDELKLRDETAIRRLREQLAEQVDAEKFFQFIFFRQWFDLRKYANENGIKIIGDMPLFVALDSSDVWCNHDHFKLNADGSAKVVAGVPPDFFSKTGQLWGNPIYDWEAMRSDDFSWWTARMHFTLKMFDVVRIDHFRGLSSTWEVPGNDKTAESGQWVEVPGSELFTALECSMGDLPVIAEDLGFVTPEVNKLRDEFGIAGMKILQFAFGGDAQNHDLPHNYISNCVAYTGTHDNDTTVGWWRSIKVSEREFCKKYLNSDGKEINWDLIRTAWASVADTAITPMQDILGIGSEGRMNLPATTVNNWQWRMKKDAIRPEHVKRLRSLSEIYGRAC
jgi:4-alpha-glucanotransferase